jgi:hypothetical protein
MASVKGSQHADSITTVATLAIAPKQMLQLILERMKDTWARQHYFGSMYGTC